MHPENFERPDRPYGSRYTLLWKDTTPPTRLQSMLDYVNLRHQLAAARRRNGNNAVTALLSMAKAMGYKPTTGWRKLYNRLHAVTIAPVKAFLFPVKSSSACMAGDELCSCSH